jgi:sirohydrochlorin ferrochelatase
LSSHPPTHPAFARPDATLGVIVVDHGSRRNESNDMLLRVVAMFRRMCDYSIVEPAHMELAEPTIAQAFDRCVEQGAEIVIVHPYFLLPGRHWDEDIPRLAAEAAARHEDVPYLVTAPLGVHEVMMRIMDDRIQHCLAYMRGDAEACSECDYRGQCRLHASTE